MPLLKYTTKVAVNKTAHEIEDSLSKHGATHVMKEYRQGEIVGISFKVDTPHGNLPFTIPINVERVEAVLRRQNQQGIAPRSVLSVGQPARVAWRIVKDWIEIQLALVETQMADLEEVFLPYLRFKDDKTLYDHMIEGGFQLALPSPREES